MLRRVKILIAEVDPIVPIAPPEVSVTEVRLLQNVVRKVSNCVEC